MRKPAIYGYLADTGQLSIRAVVDMCKTPFFEPDPSFVEFRVEVWTSVPVGKEQQRAHCMELIVPAPITNHKYQEAYKEILLTYQHYWRDIGATVPSDWKDGLARAVGTAMDRYALQQGLTH